jgi:hypothetical protein
MEKTYLTAGVTTLNNHTKVRFANDYIARTKVLYKDGNTDVVFLQCPQPMTKSEACTWLKTTDLMNTDRFRKAIVAADEKYNPVNTVRISNPEISLDAIKARAGIETEVAVNPS